MKQGKELNQNQWTAKYGLLNPSFCIQFYNREKKNPPPLITTQSKFCNQRFMKIIEIT